MVPIVEIPEGDGDRRKRRTLIWKEYRLAALQKAGEVNWLYTVAYGSVDAVGDGLEILGKRAGFQSTCSRRWGPMGMRANGAGIWMSDELYHRFFSFM
jgi:hypothetical protein